MIATHHTKEHKVHVPDSFCGSADNITLIFNLRDANSNSVQKFRIDRIPRLSRALNPNPRELNSKLVLSIIEK